MTDTPEYDAPQPGGGGINPNIDPATHPDLTPAEEPAPEEEKPAPPVKPAAAPAPKKV